MKKRSGIPVAAVLMAMLSIIFMHCGSGGPTSSSTNDFYPAAGTAGVTGSYWANSYANIIRPVGSTIELTGDGGYVTAGDYQLDNGATNAIAFKLNADGTIAWQKMYGDGTSQPTVARTADGGYIMSCQITVNDNTGMATTCLLVLKLDSTGLISWQKHYVTDSRVLRIQQTTEGGYALFLQKPYALSVLKLNTDGTVAWWKGYADPAGSWRYNYGGPDGMQQTADGGYVMMGYARNYPFDTNDYTWILKLNADGTVAWSKVFIGEYNYCMSIQQTLDGGYILGGRINLSPNADFLVLRLSAAGNLEWQKRWGSAGYDRIESVRETSDRRFVAVARTNSFGAGGNDFLLAQLNTNGRLMWQKTYGGTGYDDAAAVRQTSDGGFIMLGSTASFPGNGYWIIKTRTDGTCTPLDNTVPDTNSNASLSSMVPSPPVVDTAMSLASSNGNVIASDITIVVSPQAP